MYTILVTNDDGIQSPGLWALADKLSDIGEIWVVAPATQFTGAGRCFFPESDGQVRSFEPPVPIGSEIKAFSVNGSPAQCVFQAIEEIMPVRPDLVVSGINYGENLGSTVFSSGTIGAAIEAASYGFPAVAVSLEILPDLGYHNHSGTVDFSVAAFFAKQFITAVRENGFPAAVDILKVDVPRTATEDTAWRVTRVSRFNGMEKRLEKTEERRSIIWYPKPDLSLAEEDSDIQTVIHDQMVSICPMTIDLTANVSFIELRKKLTL